jgi:hypothetical protein
MNKLIIVLLFCALGFISCGTSTENPVIGIPSSTASITGKFSGSASGVISQDSFTTTGVTKAELTLTESGNEVSGTAIYVLTTPISPNTGPVRNISGVRVGSQVTFNQVFPGCKTPINLTGTIQPNSDIRFAKGEISIICNSSSNNTGTDILLKFKFDEFTMVKQP